MEGRNVAAELALQVVHALAVGEVDVQGRDGDADGCAPRAGPAPGVRRHRLGAIAEPVIVPSAQVRALVEVQVGLVAHALDGHLDRLPPPPAPRAGKFRFSITTLRGQPISSRRAMTPRRMVPRRCRSGPPRCRGSGSAPATARSTRTPSAMPCSAPATVPEKVTSLRHVLPAVDRRTAPGRACGRPAAPAPPACTQSVGVPDAA